MSFNPTESLKDEHMLKTREPATMKTVFKDNRAVFLIKKTERVCAALYLSTEHLTDSEPLKYKLRTAGLNVLERTARLLGGVEDFRDKRSVFSCMAGYLVEIISLISILKSINLLSSVNAELISAECETLNSTILDIVSSTPSEHDNTQQANMEQERKLDADFFNFADMSALSEYANNAPNNTTSAQASTTHSVESTKLAEKAGIRASARYDTMEYPSTTQPNRGARHKAILEIINRRGKVNIKDISGLIPGCSEKTVQRDINALIHDGLVQRIGKKRWSFYVLVDQSQKS